MLTRLGRAWLPLLVVAALAVGAFTVFRLHGVFGSHNEITREGSGILNDAPPFNPKTVTYEVTGPPGSTATINYLDLASDPQSLKNTPLPWALTLSTTSPSVSPNLLAQADTDSVTCRISVDGEIKNERTGSGVDAFTFCLVKSA